MIEYVVMVDRSAGNESVGEMWTDTYVFPEISTLAEIDQFIFGNTGIRGQGKAFPNVRLQIAQRPNENKG